ncbi:PKD domain-containing protein, partial [Arenibacter sp. F26102]|uniref:PKD domain-containing protein n=1 Tax=Arenibacter sp. F26102 TaxID=2926416 RepID=UPI001FF386EB
MGSIDQGTSLNFGPDGRLYVAEYEGLIKIFTILRNGSGNYEVLNTEILNGIQGIKNHNDNGTTFSSNLRETVGLTVAGTAANPVIYVSSSDFRIGGGSGGGNGDLGLDTNSGVITRFTWNGSSWAVVDLIRGLPRSEENHATNGMEFVSVNGTDYLIVAQGGHTNAGSPSANFAYTSEYALSAAVLSINLSMLNAMPIINDNGRSYIYDIPTLDDPTRANANGIIDPGTPGYNGVDVNDPWGGNDGLNQAMVVPGGPVQIFSPGYRNAYDLVLTESGSVYVTDNGANGGWGGFPNNEGMSGTVTNNYNPLEPGSSSSSGGEQINNVDHLSLVTTDIQNYSFGSFYGGHANPIRANPSGAGLYTNPSQNGTSGAVFRTLIYDPSSPGPGFTDDPSIALPANWPPVAQANPIEGDWRGPGIANPDGPVDALVTVWGTNTNGIDEYTASNFNNAMKGDLIAGKNGGVLRRVQLKPDGSLKALNSTFASGIGGNVLGITCNSDTDPFPGTIWLATFNSAIVVMEPQDFVSCIQPGEAGYDANADYDSDGYANQDEEDNGTDACNGGSQPSDFDKSAGGVLVSDLNDTDDDNDGILDAIDPFQLGDPTTSGSDAFTLPVDNELFSDSALGGYLGLGMTGMMNNGAANPNWLNWLDDTDNGPNPNDILGGAIGAMTMQMTSGTALGNSNDQEKGFQYGVQVDQTTGTFTVSGNVVNFNAPQQLYGNASTPNGELGIFIGDGTQSDYIKFVITKAGLTVQQEVNDLPQAPINLAVATGSRPNSGAAFYFVVDPPTGQIALEYAFDGGARQSLGNITAQGAVLTAIQQAGTDLAVGLIGTSNESGVELEGTWDFLRVVSDNENFALRINVGGLQINSNGKVFLSDQYFIGGQSYTNAAAQVPVMYQTERSSPSKTFSYNIPLANDDYIVILHFAEIYWGATGGKSGATGSRVFDVNIEGALVLDNYDILADVGAETLVTKSFPVTLIDGTLNIGFSSLAAIGGVDQPKISAIEILSANSQFPSINVNPITNQNNNINDQISLGTSASGGDPDANFNFSISGQPSGVEIEPTNGLIFGNINASAVNGGPNGDGVHSVIVTVSKPGSSPVNEVFSWTIFNDSNLSWSDKDENEGYTARHECSFVQAGNKFYLMGGRENPKTLDVYDYASDSWIALSNSAPVEFNHYQATEYQGLIWVIGAFKTNIFPNEVPADFIWAFDPAVQQWIQGPEIPSTRKRGSTGLVVYNDKFYIVGGNTIGHNGGYVNWFDEYDPETGTWTQLANAPRARDHFHAAVIDGKLYAAGGRLSGGTGGTFKPVIPQVDVYNFSTGSWSTLPTAQNIPTPRAAASVAVFNDKLVVIGGEVQDELVYGVLTDDALRITEEYDPSTESWTRLADLNFERHGTQAIVSGQGIFVIAGSPSRGGGNQKNMEFLGEDSPIGNPSVASTLTAPGSVEVHNGTNTDISLGTSGGNVGVIVRSMQLSGPDASEFSIVSGKIVNGLLKPNSTHMVEVSFNGSNAGKIATLTVNYGSSNQLTIALESTLDGNQAPVALATGTPMSGTPPLVVNFTGSNSTDDVGIVAYSWNFGDGTPTSSSADPSHSFNTSGSYNVVLTVTDEGDLQDSDTIVVNVGSPPQNGVVSLTLVDADLDVDMFDLSNGQQINLTTTQGKGLNIRANTNPATVGSVLLTLSGPVNKTRNENVSPYALLGDSGGNYYGQQFPLGNYNVSATAFSGSSQTGTNLGTLTIPFSIVDQGGGNQAPNAVASATPLNGNAPLIVNFTGSNSTDDNGVSGYSWDFGDGTAIVTTANPSHTYTVAGIYTAVLTVMDSGGLEDTQTVVITVEDVPQNAVASFTLVYADLDVDMFNLSNGQQINLTTTQGKGLNIRANTNPATVGSVLLTLSG